jgi:hypothetical protein
MDLDARVGSMLLAVLFWWRHTYETTEVGSGGPSGGTSGSNWIDGINLFPFRHLRQRPGPIIRFYCDALGFEKAESHEIGSEFARLMDLPDVTVTSQFIRKGTTSIELLGFTEPPRSATHRPGPSTNSV